MEVLRNGKFSLRYGSSDLIKGIKARAQQTREQQGIVELSGMIGKNGTLASLPELSAIDTSAITDGFPYPQLFVLKGFIIVCGLTDIYEYDTSLELKLTVSGGHTWSLFESHQYVYMSNGTVAVVRDPIMREYAVTSSLPAFTGVCNYNGQAVIGAPRSAS